MYVLDSWNIGSGWSDSFSYSFDGVSFPGWEWNYPNFPSNLCGAGNGDNYVRIFGTVPHTATSVTFRITSEYDQATDNESFGIRDLYLLIDSSVSTPSKQCIISQAAVSSRSCICSEGTYYTGSTCAACHSNCNACYGPSASECYNCKWGTSGWNGNSCVPCDASCSHCFGSNANQCGYCAANYYYFEWTTECFIKCPFPLVPTSTACYGDSCVSPCTKDQFVYWDSSCSSTCPFPYQQDVVATVVKICKYPCTDVEYLYSDGTCRHECPSPLTISYTKGNMKLCTSSCSTTNYLYWTGACVSTCPSPFISKVQYGRNFCYPPCPSGQYLYWNNDCMNTCSGFLTATSTNGVLYCNFPCPSISQYLYWNGSCYSDCAFPLRGRTEKERLYCDYPGPTSSFLYWDSTSETTCVFPLLQRIEGTGTYARQYCDYKCTLWEHLYWNGVCMSECLFPLTAVMQKGRRFCNYPCSGSQYLYWNSSCIGQCNFPLSSRTWNGALFCDYPCDTSEFLYADGTCDSTCLYPFNQRVEGSPMQRQFCDFPCGMPRPVFYWNGTCMENCHFLFSKSFKYSQAFCNFPCSNGYYLNYDGSCVPFCNSPLITIAYGVEKYCMFSCPSAFDFYYWNHTCLSTCPQPLLQKTLGDQKWCTFPCQSNQFLMFDGSCSETCEYPFEYKYEAGYKYCIRQCQNIDHYLYWNNSCLDSCKPPLRNQSFNSTYLCLLPCDNQLDYYNIHTGECQSECLAPARDESHLYLTCLSPPVYIDYGSILDNFIPSSRYSPYAVIEMLQYIRYIDMPLPPRLRELILSQSKGILTLRHGLPMSESVREQFAKHPLPDMYERNNLHSEFLVNFWEELTSWMIVCIATFFIMGIEKVLSRRQVGVIKVIFTKLRVISAWNLCLILLATSIDDIIFFSALNFRSREHLNASFSVLSLEIAIFMLCILIFLFVGIFFVVKRFASISLKIRSSSTHEFNQLVQRWEGFQVFFNGFNKKTFILNRWFYLLYMIRIGLPMIICFSLEQYPLAQVILYLAFSFFILGYILGTKPLIRKINYYQLVTVETAVFVINLCLFIMKICHLKTAQNTHQFAMLGDVIVCASTFLNFSNMGFFVWKILNASRIITSHLSKDRSASQAMWIQLVVIYLQQGGMGFEEIFIDLKTKKIFSGSDQIYQKDENIDNSSSMAETRSSIRTEPINLTETELLETTFAQSGQDFFDVPRVVRRSAQRRPQLELENNSIHYPISNRHGKRNRKMILS